MLTTKQLEARRNHIGGSDVAAIMGLSPWANAHDVYLQKTANLDDQPEAMHLTAGTFVERGILDWAETNLGPITRNQYRSNLLVYLGTHSDAIVNSSGEPIECKNVGAFGPRSAEFDPSIDDGVPVDVIIQCHAHMIASTDVSGSGPKVAHIPVLLAGNNLHMFHVDWDAIVGEAIIDACVGFWEDNVLKRVPPQDIIPSLGVVKRLRREPGKIVAVDSSFLSMWVLRNDALKDAKDKLEVAQAALLAKIGDASIADCGDYGTWELRVEKAGDKIDRNAMRLDGIYSKYASPNTRQMPRFKKPKGESK